MGARGPDTGITSVSAPLLGGQVSVSLGARGPDADVDARRILARIAAWSRRLTRFSETSDLSRLNRDGRSIVHIRPTLAALLRAGRTAARRTDGIVDVTMLAARVAAEAGDAAAAPKAERSASSWGLALGRRGSAIVERQPGVGFDLDGLAKGWLADRALRLVRGPGSAAIDADGDIAIRLAAGDRWAVAVLDPSGGGATIGLLDFTNDRPADARFGVATSGTSVHRWGSPGERRHHLIDPRSGRPAVTDVVQATVVASSACDAEAYAKLGVILGSHDGLAALESPGVPAAILVTERDEVILGGGAAPWLR